MPFLCHLWRLYLSPDERSSIMLTMDDVYGDGGDECQACDACLLCVTCEECKCPQWKGVR